MKSHPKIKVGWWAKVRLRLRKKDGHYSGGLAAGSRILELFGDAATKLCLRETGGKSEGLFRAYKEVEFLKPVHVGDTIEATATVTQIGNSSRTMSFTATKIHPRRQVVCTATGTVVIPAPSGTALATARSGS